jgi:hypothetical protein
VPWETQPAALPTDHPYMLAVRKRHFFASGDWQTSEYVALPTFLLIVRVLDLLPDGLTITIELSNGWVLILVLLVMLCQLRRPRP